MKHLPLHLHLQRCQRRSLQTRESSEALPCPALPCPAFCRQQPGQSAAWAASRRITGLDGSVLLSPCSLDIPTALLTLHAGRVEVNSRRAKLADACPSVPVTRLTTATACHCLLATPQGPCQHQHQHQQQKLRHCPNPLPALCSTPTPWLASITATVCASIPPAKSSCAGWWARSPSQSARHTFSTSWLAALHRARVAR